MMLIMLHVMVMTVPVSAVSLTVFSVACAGMRAICPIAHAR